MMLPVACLNEGTALGDAFTVITIFFVPDANDVSFTSTFLDCLAANAKPVLPLNSVVAEFELRLKVRVKSPVLLMVMLPNATSVFGCAPTAGSVVCFRDHVRSYWTPMFTRLLTAVFVALSLAKARRL